MISVRLHTFVFRRETLTLALLLVAVAVGSQLSPYFLNSQTFGLGLTQSLEVGVMALSMTPLIMIGDIDLSVASILGLVAVVFAEMTGHGVPLGVAVTAALVVGTCAGALNGLLVTRFGLSSIVVTLGTLALYGGLAEAIAGSQEFLKFPAAFVGSDTRFVVGTVITVPHVLFLALAVVAAVVLHRLMIGRQIMFAGASREVARLAGVRVDRIRIGLFATSGLTAAFAALLLASRLASVDAGTGQGLSLLVITVVLLGGTDIRGGRGTIFGSVLALLVLVAVRSGMGLANVADDVQVAVVGGLLVFAVAAEAAIDVARARTLARQAMRRIANAAEAPPARPGTTQPTERQRAPR